MNRKILTSFMTSRPSFRSGIRGAACRQVRLSSYYVLLPELPQDTRDTNPLLTNTGDAMPDFAVSSQQCFTGLGKVALDFESQFSNLEKQIKEIKADCSFENTAVMLDRMHSDLLFIYHVARVAQLANDTPMMRSALFQGQRAVFRAAGIPSSSYTFFNAVRTLQKDAKDLKAMQLRLLDKFMADGKNNGADLSLEEQMMHRAIHSKLSEHLQKFSDNLEFATNAFWAPISDPAVLDELPKSSLNAFDYIPPALPAEAMTNPEILSPAGAGALSASLSTVTPPLEEQQGLLNTPPSREHRITLSPLSYQTIMSYCTDRLQRLNVWTAYVDRAGFVDYRRSNSLIIEEIRQLRRQEANLFGFPTYADMSMRNKMAGSLDNVMQTLINTIVPVKAVAQRDLAELQTFASAEGADHELDCWDIAYWRRRQYESKFKSVAKDSAVQKYFSYPVVLDSMFGLVHRLFGYKIKEILPSKSSNQKKSSSSSSSTFTPWHPDARVYRLEDETGKALAKLIIDPYQRSGKAPGAYFEPIRSRCDASRSQALSALLFNFPSPTAAAIAGGRSTSMMSFDDVQMLFRRFGTALHHMTCDAPYANISAVINTETDALMLPSAFMRSWLTDAEFVRSMTKSSKDGKQMPQDMVTELLAANEHMMSLDVLTQLYYGILDITLHSRTEFWQDLMRDVWEEVMPMKINKNDAHVCGLSLMFPGGYAASFYSFFYGELLAADVYDAFLTNKDKQPAIGQRYRETFLTQLGTVPTSQLFRRFRGRDLSYDSFLNQHKLNDT